MNTNSLDLYNDILNIIGGYVKKDNADRMEKLIKGSFKQVDILYNILKRIVQVKRQKPIMRRLIANYFIYLVLKILKLLMNI
jgi:hypothetical protein